GDPPREFFFVDVFQAVLELRTADAIFDGEVLHRLHEERDAVDFCDLRLQATNYVGRGDIVAAILQRLQIDLHATAVDRGVGAVDADKRGETLNGRVFQDGARQRLLALSHRC